MVDIEKINDLVGSKDFQVAKSEIEQGLKEAPNNLELIKLAGLVAVNLKEWQAAKSFFETAIKLDAEDATSWFYLAKCYEFYADFVAAKSTYLKVIELRHEYADAYVGLCIVLLKLNEPDSAIEYAKQAKGFNDDNYIYDFIIGISYMKLKNYNLALEFLSNAKLQAPEDIATLNSIGTCYVALKDLDSAIAIYKEVISISPNSSIAYYNLGSTYQIQQNHELACEYLSQAYNIDEDETYLVALAMSEIKLKRYAEALEHYKQLAVMCPSKENYKYNIVTCYELMGDYQTAIKMLEGIVYINPKFVLPAQKLASLYIKVNELNKAKEIYDNILLKNAANAETLHQYAILSSSLCDTATAERILKKVIKMNPELAKAHKDLGILYLNKRLFDYAEDEFKTAMKLEPNDFDILFEYGNFLYSLSRNQEAEEYYSLSLSLNPNNVIALTFMGLNELVLNKLDSAKEYIMKALKLEPHHEYVQFCAGRILYACGEYEDAQRYLIRAVEQNPDVETQNTLALTYFKLNNFEQALNIFKNINKKNPESISVLMDIARCYEALNENDCALEYLDKVVSIFPDNEEAHEMIRKLS